MTVRGADMLSGGLTVSEYIVRGAPGNFLLGQRTSSSLLWTGHLDVLRWNPGEEWGSRSRGGRTDDALGAERLRGCR
jgi:hypothetical protein